MITGAAGSIVSAITADLAAASGGTFYLLDLAPEPNPADPDLDRFANDREGLKRDLFARIQARGERATPALVEKELAALERVHAARTAIDAVRAAGGTAHYFAVNLTDAEGVAKVIDQVRARSGRIDVLLHAAGIERSHFLPDKDPREFDLVLRRQERRLVPPHARHRRHAARGGGGVQLDRRPLRQRGAGGLQRCQRSVVQDRLQLPHHASGHARHRHRLDGMGGHRHGHARIHPKDDGTRRASTCCRRRRGFRGSAAN